MAGGLGPGLSVNASRNKTVFNVLTAATSEEQNLIVSHLKVSENNPCWGFYELIGQKAGAIEYGRLHICGVQVEI